MYISYDEYAALYGSVDCFDRLCYDACRHIDRLTTSVDGVKKLKVAFPADEDSAAAVKHCAARVINILAQIQSAESAAAQGCGYIQTENGLQSKVISSVSAGNETVSFSAGGTIKTVIDAASVDTVAREKLIRDTVREYLSGATDANGVNLLYMGPYPI